MQSDATLTGKAAGRGRVAGWPLVGWAFLSLTAMVLLTLAVFGVTEEGMHAVVRYTARSSLALFGAAFVASSVRVLWPTPATRWLLVNRRYLGVSFAVSHALHLAGILSLARMSSAFRADVDMVTVVFGGFGFVVAGVLAATSSNGAVAWMGARRWRALHKFGVYYLWFIFFVTYLPAAMARPGYIGFVAILIAMLGLRLWATRTAR
jgi:DMSO/TMAO reductase YedYZ heme-binding membrane subunit